jgi:hypothetical protein
MQAIEPYNFLHLFDSSLFLPESKEALAAIYLLGYMQALVTVEKSSAHYAQEAWQEAEAHLVRYI